MARAYVLKYEKPAELNVPKIQSHHKNIIQDSGSELDNLLSGASISSPSQGNSSRSPNRGSPTKARTPTIREDPKLPKAPAKAEPKISALEKAKIAQEEAASKNRIIRKSKPKSTAISLGGRRKPKKKGGGLSLSTKKKSNRTKLSLGGSKKKADEDDDWDAMVADSKAKIAARKKQKEEDEAAALEAKNKPPSPKANPQERNSNESNSSLNHKKWANRQGKITSLSSADFQDNNNTGGFNNANRFGSNTRAIGSDQYFGREQQHNAYDEDGANIDDLKDAVRDKAQKLGNWLGGMASKVGDVLRR